jgi:biotin operon repressor
VEEVANPALAERLKSLSEADLELLMLLGDGFSQTEIASLLGVSKQAVSKKICSLKKFF